MDIELQVTQLRVPLNRLKTEPLLPPIVREFEYEHERRSNSDDSLFDFSETSSRSRRFSLPDVNSTAPEVTYGMRPRMAWMYRLMERAGVGARSARALPWYENEKEAFQHHSEYLKRLSKLREELIQQEQNNLAHALDRLRMRSYGREYVYSQPQKEKKGKQRLSAQTENPAKRTSLLTTFEKFQRMRPKKDPPTIMPLEGKSLIDSVPTTERLDRHDRRHVTHNNHSKRGPERSMDENVRLNLQRLMSHPIPSIPRQRRNQHKDIVLESSSFRRNGTQDANNSSTQEDRIASMQKQKQKLMRLRHEAREAEKLKLMPQSFRIDTLSDDDRMNLEKLKDYYCIYYVPAPSSSPVGSETDLHIHLPRLGSNGSCIHSGNEESDTALLSSRSNNSKKVGFRVSSDFAIPPTVCSCACRMYVSGNKVETPFDQIDYSISKTHAVNNPTNGFHPSTPRKNTNTNNNNTDSSRGSSRSTDKTWSQKSSAEKKTSPQNTQERMQIRVDMPAIVYNTTSSPEPGTDLSTGLAKAFKQKELRQRELSHLKEDIKELNKISANLTETVS